MRLIDADELIKCIPLEEYNSRLAVMNAPTIDPQEWIPCSERLPEEGIEVLGTDDSGCIRHVVKDKSALYEFATYEEMMHINIVAWMPLPEPYKGEE